MFFLRRLSLFVIVALVAVPLVIIRAQDNGQSGTPSDDQLVPSPRPPTQVIPTFDVNNIPAAQSATPYLIDYPTATFSFPLAQTATPDLIDYPTEDTGTVTFPLDTCGNDDPDTLFVPLCPPTPTPKPAKTAVPTTAIINGLWVLDPKASGYHASGQCQIPGGDNGGPDTDTSLSIDQLPKVPVCMTTDNQWITVDSSGPYPLVVPNIYSQQSMSRELLETNGATSGSVNVTTTRQYQVISPSEVEFSYIRHEEGGCTTTSTVRYKLVEANNLVCSGTVMTPDFTAVPTQMPTAQPGETQQPPVTPEPPIQIGDYTIQLPPVDATCKAEQMPPTSTVNINYDNNQNMVIHFGTLTFTLYWNGSTDYEYRDGNQFMVGMTTYTGGASLSWSKQGCFVNSALSGAGLPATAVPAQASPTAVPTMDIASQAGQSYSVKADAPEYLCATANQSMLPDLSKATLTAQADNTMTFSVDGKDYPLTSSNNGLLAYVETKPDGSILTISMNGFTDGIGNGNYMAMTADGSKSCIAQLTFTPR